MSNTTANLAGMNGEYAACCVVSCGLKAKAKGKTKAPPGR